eukprot:9296240-Pyramimonas_sp.AAC.1
MAAKRSQLYLRIGLPSSCRRCSRTSLVCMLLARSWMLCSLTRAKNLPSMPRAQDCVVFGPHELCFRARVRAIPACEHFRQARVGPGAG